MNKKKVVIISIITCVLLTGCTLGKTKGEENVKDFENKKMDETISNTEPLATKEFIMETFQLTEEEFNAYRVEEYISKFNLSESYFLEEKSDTNDFSIIIDNLKILQEIQQDDDQENYDFSYLIKADEYNGEYPDIKSIKYLAVSQQYGDGGKSILIDFEKNIKFYSKISNHVYDNIQYAEGRSDFTEDEKNDMIQALTNAQIWEWNYMYSSDKKAADESWWHFGVEFENGIIITYKGEGKVPQNYTSLEEELFKN
jgi:hypothetical protein